MAKTQVRGRNTFSATLMQVFSMRFRTCLERWKTYFSSLREPASLLDSSYLENRALYYALSLQSHGLLWLVTNGLESSFTPGQESKPQENAYMSGGWHVQCYMPDVESIQKYRSLISNNIKSKSPLGALRLIQPAPFRLRAEW